MSDQFNSLPGSNAWLARQMNVARKQSRDEKRPQVAAAIYAGYVANPNGQSKEWCMTTAIEDADELLLRLYPPLPELDTGK